MITWPDVERITHGELGRTFRLACPFCSSTRRQANQRKPVFAVKLKEPDFAIYRCAHCEASGYVHPDKPQQWTTDLAELRRRRALAERRELDDKQQRTASALKLWEERKPFFGSPADTYLRVTRGIGDWLDSFALEDLGFHPNCPFGVERLPCMLALVRDIKTDAPVAIHRTALKLHDYRPEKIDRKSLGPVSGGAIKISQHCEITHGLLVAEGIETALSASKKLNSKPVWSLISTANLRTFPVLSGIECLIVAVDNDPDGIAAADECIRRQLEGGIEVISSQPNRAKDFNDIITGKTNG